MSGLDGGLTLSALLSEHHRREQAEPSYSTVAPVPGGPAPGEAADREHDPLGLQPPPKGLLLVPPQTLDDLAPAIWGIEEHLRQVAERSKAWPACDWHAIDRVTLSSTPSVDGYQYRGNPVLVMGRTTCRRLTVYNPTPAVLYLGESSGTALQNPAAVIPALSNVVLPWNSNDVEIAADPAAVAFDLPTVLLVRSDRETDEIRVDRLGGTLGAGASGIQDLGRTTPLAAAATFTSQPITMAPAIAVNIQVKIFTDQAGNWFWDIWLAGGWRQAATGAITANTVVSTTITAAPWGRLRVVNGATPQTVFEAMVIGAPA